MHPLLQFLYRHFASIMANPTGLGVDRAQTVRQGQRHCCLVHRQDGGLRGQDYIGGQAFPQVDVKEVVLVNRHPGQGTNIILLLVASGDPGKGQHGIGYSHQRGIGLSGNKEQTTVNDGRPLIRYGSITGAVATVVVLQGFELTGNFWRVGRSPPHFHLPRGQCLAFSRLFLGGGAFPLGLGKDNRTGYRKERVG